MRTYSRTCVLKSFVIALVVASIVAIILLGGVESGRAETWVRSTPWVWGPIRFSAAMAESLGLGVAFGRLESILLGEALFMTGGMAALLSVWAGLNTKISGRPMIDRIWPTTPDILDTRLVKRDVDAIDAFSGKTQFTARKEELQELLNFATRIGKKSKFLSLTGREGVGKTRTGLEWLYQLKGLGWDTGVLVSSVSPVDIARARFRRKTAILVNDPSRWPNFTPQLTALLRHPNRVRILIADQIPYIAPRDLTHADTQLLEDADFGVLRIEPLGREALTVIAPDASEKALNNADGRPLYALLGDDPWIELQRRAERRLSLMDNAEARHTLALAALAGPIPASVTKLGLGRLTRLFEGEKRDLLRRQLPALRPEMLADTILLQHLEEITEAAGETLMKTALAANPEAVEQRIANLWSRKLSPAETACRDNLQATFDGTVPDRIQVIRAETTAASKATKATTLSASDTVATLAAPLATLVRFADARPFDRHIRIDEASGAVNAIDHYGQVGRIAEVEYWGKRLIALADDPMFANDLDIRDREAWGAVHAMNSLGSVGLLADMARWGKRLITTVEDERFSNHQFIRLREARGAQVAVEWYGEACKFDDLELWAHRIVTLAQDPLFKGNTEIRISEAISICHAIRVYGNAKNFEKMENWSTHLFAMTSDPLISKNDEILNLIAIGMENAASFYSMAHQFEPYERWAKCLIDLSATQSRLKNPEVFLQIACAATNAAIQYAQAMRSKDAERWEHYLLDLVNQPEFYRNRAMWGLVAQRKSIIAIEHISVGNLSGMEKLARELMNISERSEFATDTDLAQIAADIAVTAIKAYGESERFKELELWGERLTSVAHRAPLVRDRNIVILVIQGIRHAIHFYGKSGLQNDVIRWSKRLFAIADNPLWLLDNEIKTLEAGGLRCAMVNHREDGSHGEAKEDTELFMPELQTRMADLAWHFIGVAEIDEIVGSVGLSRSSQYLNGRR